jgi:hypothetical protein
MTVQTRLDRITARLPRPSNQAKELAEMVSCRRAFGRVRWREVMAGMPEDRGTMEEIERLAESDFPNDPMWAENGCPTTLSDYPQRQPTSPDLGAARRSEAHPQRVLTSHDPRHRSGGRFPARSLPGFPPIRGHGRRRNRRSKTGRFAWPLFGPQGGRKETD